MTNNSARNRKRRRGRLIPVLLLLLFIGSALYLVPRWLGLTGDCSGGGLGLPTAFSVTPPAPVTIPANQIYSRNALLIRLSDQSILYAKEDSARTYPASLTKMMTVLTFLENCAKEGESPEQLLSRLRSQTFAMPADIYPVLEQRHASVAGLKPGEIVTLEDLLYACHLPSGADGSMGLAIFLAGSESGFVDLMNAKAAELGMKNTHFANVTGLHDPQHYTTADDLALLMEHGLKNPLFRKILTSTSYQMAPTALHPEGMKLHSTVARKMESPQVSRTTVLGGKTGYTEEAGLCLATLAKKGSQEYILITMGAPGNNRTEQFNVTDATAIYGAL